jgi:hypothetical protein
LFKMSNTRATRARGRTRQEIEEAAEQRAAATELVAAEARLLGRKRGINGAKQRSEATKATKKAHAEAAIAKKIAKEVAKEAAEVTEKFDITGVDEDEILEAIALIRSQKDMKKKKAKTGGAGVFFAAVRAALRGRSGRLAGLNGPPACARLPRPSSAPLSLAS